MTIPRRILVRSPNWVGDQVMALGAYEQLRANYPKAHLTLLRPDNLSGLNYPHIFNEQLNIQTSDRRSLYAAFALSRGLRAMSFDLAIALTASPRSVLPFWFARIPYRVGFDCDGTSLFLTSSIPWKGVAGAQHKSDLYRDLVDYLGGHTSLRLLPPLEPAAPRENLIVVAPGASIPLREWPYVPELLVLLKDRYPLYKIVVVGGRSEAKWCSTLASHFDDQIEDLIGKTSLSELTALCKKAKLVISNDSGVAHISGTLAQSPTLVLFGPGNPSYIKPLGPRVYEARDENLACSPCEKPYCRSPYGYQRCLTNLSAKQILAQVETILG